MESDIVEMLNSFLPIAAYALIAIILFVFLMTLFYRGKADNAMGALDNNSDSFVPFDGYLKTNGPDINYVGDDWILSRENHREIAKMAESNGVSANKLVARMLQQYRRY